MKKSEKFLVGVALLLALSGCVSSTTGPPESKPDDDDASDLNYQLGARYYFNGDYDLARDLYIVLGDPQANGGWAVRTYIKPVANWIWLGTIIMSLGGVLSLTDRRFRVAAGARKTPRGAVPAE